MSIRARRHLTTLQSHSTLKSCQDSGGGVVSSLEDEVFMSGPESDHLAWIKNPLLNIEKAVELKKLRRDVPLKMIVDGLSRDEISLFTLYKVEGNQLTTNNLTCSSPVLGKWVNDCDFPFVMETLLLSDRVFKREFPGIQLSEEERKLLARELDAHSKVCRRCGAKRAEDEAWKERTGAALANHGN